MSSAKISVFGLGFVGGTTAKCFALLGNKVIGVDIDSKKLVGYPFWTTNDCKVAVKNSNISFVCVETPCNKTGDIDMTALETVCKQIGEAIKEKEYHQIVIRSTFYPGKLDELIKIIEIASGKACGIGFDIAVNPEFLREAYAIQDFLNPPFIVVGAIYSLIVERIFECYKGISAEKIDTDPKTAQLLKYVCNVWHSCKVAFTNEIGEICKKEEVIGDELMELFCKDKKLNISEKYHEIGRPYGGNCLPKDLSVIQKHLPKDCPLIHSISKSNELRK